MGTIVYTPLSEIISEKQISNLRKLLKYLQSLPENYRNFSMDYFAAQDHGTPIASPSRAHECGTVCCVIGHGIAAGIPCTGTEDSWSEYADKNFLGGEDGLYEFLASGEWTDINNTVQGAIKRLQILLDKGLPGIQKIIPFSFNNDTADLIIEHESLRS